MKGDLKAVIEAWRVNVELECSGASLSAIERIAIGGAILELESLLPVLEFADEAAARIEALEAQLAEGRRVANLFIATNDDCDGTPGLMDAIDNDGAAYQSKWLASALIDARTILQQKEQP